MSTVPTPLVPYPTDPWDSALAPVGIVPLWFLDVTPPAVNLVSPGAGSLLGSSTAPITIDVTDNVALANVTLFVAFTDSTEEVAWNGSGFASGYSGGSTVSTIAGGKRFILVRNSTWMSNPTVYVSAVDTSGNRVDLLPFSFLYTFTSAPVSEVPASAAVLAKFFPDTTGVDFGTDVSLQPALDDAWLPQGGTAILLEQCLRRLTTRRGHLDFSPNDGIDVRDFLRDDMDVDGVFQVKQAVENEMLKDERIEDCDVLARYQISTGTMALAITITTSTGPFKLVLNVTELTVDILSAEAV